LREKKGKGKREKGKIKPQEILPNKNVPDRDVFLFLVGDTGFEPVTSAV
jgi:hypothetical protein